MRLLAMCMALLVACGPAGSQSIGLPLSYETNVRPIVASYCAGCHKQGGQIELTADNMAVLRSEVIKRLDDGSMPPWLPGDDSQPLLNSRALPTGAKDTIKAWFDAGAPTGSYYPGPLSLPPSHPAPILPADFSVTFPVPIPTSAESYRCYAKPLPMSGIASAILYNVPDSAHHTGAWILAAADVPSAMKDPGGAECISGVGAAPVVANLSSVGGGPARGIAYPDDVGQPLPPGAWLVMNIHALPGPQTKPFGVEFWLAAAGEKRKPLVMASVSAPIEVPCPGGPQANGPCSRDDAFVRSVLLTPAELRSLSDQKLIDCGHTLAELTEHIPPAGPDGHYWVHTDCTIPAPSGRLLSIQPHLHVGFAAWRLDRSRRGGPWEPILTVPMWRGPQWEESFSLVEPYVAGLDERWRVSCELDNGDPSQNGLDGSIAGDYQAMAPRRAPRWVSGFYERDQKMCTAILTLAQ